MWETATPSVITNDNSYTVVFRVKAESLYGAITNVIINLSAIGGPISAIMTNEAGSSNWRYAYYIPAGTLPPGREFMPVSASDDQGGSANGQCTLDIVTASANAPPDIPAIPQVPTATVVGLLTPMNCYSTDPEGDNIRFNLKGAGWEGADLYKIVNESSAFGPSGVTQGMIQFSACASYTLRARAEDVFVAGDVALGAKLMIDAIASGKLAARKIYAFLNKKEFITNTVVAHQEIVDYSRESGYENIRRSSVPAISPEQRKRAMNLQVEKGFTQDQSRRQADRCFNCGVNTIFDSEKCILCGGCADVCPEACLKLVSAENLQGEGDFSKIVNNYFGDIPISEGGAIIKDETICIRCGLCAARCPVGAITMEAFKFKEVMSER